MRRNRPVGAGIAALLAAALAAPGLAQQQPAAEEEPIVGPGDQAVARMIDLNGEQIGSANLTGLPAGGVLIGIQADGLPPERWLGFHIHEGGECDPEQGFETAGGHFNPEGTEHGYFPQGGPHAGDMPNQFVPANGTLRAQVYNHMVSLDGDQPNIRGLTLMIHSAPDDYETQPDGDAGERLACGVIE